MSKNERWLMRTESEVLDLILQFANEDERVRAVIMNGSESTLRSTVTYSKTTILFLSYLHWMNLSVIGLD